MARASDLAVLTIVIDGERIEIDQKSWTYHERSLITATLTKYFKSLGLDAKDHDPDAIDYIMAAIWLHRRRRNPTVKFDDVAKSLDLGQLADAAEEQQATPIDQLDDSPESSGVDS